MNRFIVWNIPDVGLLKPVYPQDMSGFAQIANWCLDCAAAANTRLPSSMTRSPAGHGALTIPPCQCCVLVRYLRDTTLQRSPPCEAFQVLGQGEVTQRLVLFSHEVGDTRGARERRSGSSSVSSQNSSVWVRLGALDGAVVLGERGGSTKSRMPRAAQAASKPAMNSEPLST